MPSSYSRRWRISRGDIAVALGAGRARTRARSQLVGRLAIGHREVRQPQLVELELQVDHLGHAQRVVHGVGQLAVEQAAHLGR